MISSFVQMATDFLDVEDTVDCLYAGRALIIDGRSGSGKSTLARKIAEKSLSQLLAMDEFYPGWHGLGAASAMLPKILETCKVPVYDWEIDAVSHTRRLDPRWPIIIEGCGSLTYDTRKFLQRNGVDVLSFWVDAAADVRYNRAIARDGDVFAPYWEIWASQEDTHIADNAPQNLADFALDASDFNSHQILKPI